MHHVEINGAAARPHHLVVTVGRCWRYRVLQARTRSLTTGESSEPLLISSTSSSSASPSSPELPAAAAAAECASLLAARAAEARCGVLRDAGPGAAAAAAAGPAAPALPAAPLRAPDPGAAPSGLVKKLESLLCFAGPAQGHPAAACQVYRAAS